MNQFVGTREEIFLHPGQTFFGDSANRIGTLLGSCIAICLWHPKRRIGGMCHFVLPKNSSDSGNPLNGRYGTDAVKILEREAKLRRTTLPEYHASIYGGGNVVAALSASKEDTVGAQNAGFAMDILLQKEVPILVVDVGETWARRISMDLSSGMISVKLHGNTFIST